MWRCNRGQNAGMARDLSQAPHVAAEGDAGKL